MTKRVLMIAFHFPPLAGSSGIQRTLRFVQQLPSHSWQPLVLSASPNAYERVSDDLVAQIPTGTEIRRALALDAARHLSIRGRYIAATARPDRWASWRLDGVRQGLKLIEKFRPQVIWSTYPIATAHLIGLALHRKTGIPWIADFRDPMAQEGYPADPKIWAAFEGIERQAIELASISSFTTPGAARVYRERYPHRAKQISVLENGYDEESFAIAESIDVTPQPLLPGAITMLHSGIVYPKERDPEPLMLALSRLKVSGVISASNFRLRFRAAVHDELLHKLAERLVIDDLIETLPAIGYAEALQEMRCADALLIMQGADCNDQIPAKTYEYLRAGRPILCLSDSLGDTAGVIRSAGLSDIGRLEDTVEVEEKLRHFIFAVRDGSAVLPTAEAVNLASRSGRSAQLATQLDSLC